MWGAAKAAIRAAYSAVSWNMSIGALHCARTGKNEPMPQVCDAEETKWLKSMYALSCSFDALVSWDLADLVAMLWWGLIFPVSPPPLCLLVALVECLVWRKTLFHVLGHIFDLLSAFCYFPFFSFYSWSLTVPLSPPLPVPPSFLSLLSSHTE